MFAKLDSFIQNAEELVPLFSRHYDELSLMHGRFELAPNWTRYSELELFDQLLFITLREGDPRNPGPIRGYFSGILSTHLHYATCMALHPDMYFILPEWRGRSAGAFQLFRKVQKEAELRGVRHWQTATKNKSPEAARLMKALGFTPTDVVWGKWLNEPQERV